MKSVDYLKIVKESAEMMWRKKILALFGLFIFLGSLSGSFTIKGDEQNSDNNSKLMDFMLTHETIMLGLVVFIIILFLILFFLRATSIGSVVKFSSGLVYSEKIGFKELFGMGRKYAFKIIVTDVLFFLAIVALAVTLSVPVIFLIYSNARAVGILIGVIAAAIVIPVAFMAYFIKRYAYVFLVTLDMGIRPSIEKAYAVFSQNVSESIIFTLIIALVWFVVFSGAFFVILFVALILAIPAAIAYFAVSNIFGYVVLALAIAIICAIVVFAESCLKAFVQIAWVLFTRELEGKKTNEKKVAEELIIGGQTEAENV